VEEGEEEEEEEEGPPLVFDAAPEPEPADALMHRTATRGTLRTTEEITVDARCSRSTEKTTPLEAIGTRELIGGWAVRFQKKSYSPFFQIQYNSIKSKGICRCLVLLFTRLMRKNDFSQATIVNYFQKPLPQFPNLHFAFALARQSIQRLFFLPLTT
jgi:hypothetical protein